MKRTATLNEVRALSADELRVRLSRLEAELFRLRISRATNQLENTMLIRATRRDIGRLMTVLNQQFHKASLSSNG
jgi:large subunit ribosomal protein L29